MAKGKKKARKKAEKRARRVAACTACGTVATLPKKKCCESRSRCARCPLRMLKEGTLPHGYTVHKRKLVTVEKAAEIRDRKRSKKAAKAA